MFFFTIEVEPEPGTEQAKDTGGAYAVCWINFKLQDGAEHLAKFYLEKEGWKPKEVKKVAWVEKEDYEDEPELMQYYKEAEQDGASFVFHEWPIDAEDSHEEDEGEW